MKKVEKQLNAVDSELDEQLSSKEAAQARSRFEAALKQIVQVKPDKPKKKAK